MTVILSIVNIADKLLKLQKFYQEIAACISIESIICL